MTIVVSAIWGIRQTTCFDAADLTQQICQQLAEFMPQLKALSIRVSKKKVNPNVLPLDVSAEWRVAFAKWNKCDGSEIRPDAGFEFGMFGLDVAVDSSFGISARIGSGNPLLRNSFLIEIDDSQTASQFRVKDRAIAIVERLVEITDCDIASLSDSSAPFEPSPLFQVRKGWFTFSTFDGWPLDDANTQQVKLFGRGRIFSMK